MTDAAFWAKLAVGVAGVALTLAGAMWADLRRRVARIEGTLEKKADRCDMQQRRSDIKELFETTTEVKIDVATIKQQVNQFASDLESEKRTRAEINKEIMHELRLIREKIRA